jgi:hypothetical protein
MQALVPFVPSQWASSTRWPPDRARTVVTLYRQCDSRFAFLWGSARQPRGRWHGDGAGPVQYLANTPDGAWAELLRHEEIQHSEDIEGVERALWAVEVAEMPEAVPELGDGILRGAQDSYPACQAEAQRLRDLGRDGLVAPSAAIREGNVSSWKAVGEVNVPGPEHPAIVAALFGPRPDLEGWLLVDRGAPPFHVLGRVRHFRES